MNPPFWCPHCHRPLNVDRGDPVCGHAVVEDRILCFGEGYASSIIADHERNLAPDLIDGRRAFDARYAVYCVCAHKEFCPGGFELAAKRSLSLGCGLGLDVLELKQFGYDAYGFEVADMLPIWREHLGPDASRCVLGVPDDPLPFEDGAFDLIYSGNVLEHVGTEPPQEFVSADTFEIRKRFIEQAINKLRPGGLFVLTAPNRAYPFDTGHPHHYIPDSHKMFTERGFTFTDPCPQ